MSSVKKLNFFSGLKCLPKGFIEILSDFKIFLFILIPMVLGSIMIYCSFYYGWDWSTLFLKKQMASYLSDWISDKGFIFRGLFYVFNFITKILFTVLAIYVGFILIQLISIPFYSMACERVLAKRKVFPVRTFNLGVWLRLNLRLFTVSVFRMLIFLFFGIIVFVVSFIPGLHLLALVYSGYVISVDCADYTLEIYDVSLFRRMSIYVRNLSFFMGVTVVLLPTLFLPGLTLVLLPVTVVGTAVCLADSIGKEEYEKLIA